MGWSWDRFKKNWNSEDKSESHSAAPPEEDKPGFFARAWEGTKSAGSWVVNKGPSAAWNFTKEAGMYAAATFPPTSAVAGGLEAVLGDKTPGFISGVNDRREQMTDAVVGFAKFAKNDPARAFALAGQGAVNGVTGLAGLGYDLTVGALGNYVVRPAVNRFTNVIIEPAVDFYNMGTQENYKETDYHWDRWKFFQGTDWLNENTQIRDLPKGLTDFARIDREGFDRAFGDIQTEIHGPDGKLIPNPNANYERVLLYGPQFVTEAAAFTVVGGFTMGYGGAALGAARAGSWAPKIMKWAPDGMQMTSMGTRTMEQVRHADIVKDLANVEQKIEKAQALADDMVKQAAAKLDELKAGASSADEIAEAEKALKLAQEKVDETLKQAESQVEALKAPGANATPEEIANKEKLLAETQKSAEEATKKAEEQLATMKASADDVAKAERGLARAKADGARKVEQVEKEAYTGKWGLGSTDHLRRIHKFEELGEKLEDAEEGINKAVDVLNAAKATENAEDISAATKALAEAQRTYDKTANRLNKLTEEPGFRNTFYTASDSSILTKEALDRARVLARELNEATNNKLTAEGLVKTSEQNLKFVRRAGGSADDIKKAEEALEKSEDGLKLAKEALEKAKEATYANVEGGLTQQAMSATEGFSEGAKIAYYKGVNRIFNVRDHPILESSMIVGATAITVNIDMMNAEERLENKRKMAVDEFSRVSTAAQYARGDFDSSQAAPNVGSVDNVGRLTDQFPRGAAENDDGSSREFNNRASGDVVRLNTPETFVLRQLSEKDIETLTKSLGQSQ